LSSPAGPSASSARRRSASAAATTASPEATDAVASSPRAAGTTPPRDQLQRALGLGTGVGQHRLRLGELRLRRGDLGGGGADRLPHLLEIRLGRLHRQPERGRVDLGEQRPRLHDLVIADRHIQELALQARRDLQHQPFDGGDRGHRRGAVAGDLEREQEQQHRRDDPRPAPNRVARRPGSVAARRLGFGWLGPGAVGHVHDAPSVPRDIDDRDRTVKCRGLPPWVLPRMLLQTGRRDPMDFSVIDLELVLTLLLLLLIGMGPKIALVPFAVYPLAVPYLFNPVGITILIIASESAGSVAASALVVGLVLLVGALDFLIFSNIDKVAKRINPTSLVVSEIVFGVLLTAVAVQLFVFGLQLLGILERAAPVH
jgi:hypothetical protein